MAPPARTRTLSTASSSPAHPARRYWLFKSEPDCFSINDLAAAPDQTTCWDGVRNYQARNFLRDTIQPGDGVLYYHSNAEPLAIVGTANVVRGGYPDHTAFDPRADHFDPDSDPQEPTWYMVDIRLHTRFAEPVTRSALQKIPGLQKMELLRRGSRLSIQPVSDREWAIILELAGHPVAP